MESCKRTHNIIIKSLGLGTLSLSRMLNLIDRNALKCILSFFNAMPSSLKKNYWCDTNFFYCFFQVEIMHNL